MSADQNYDAIIVGAGPAGLSAARTLARLGFATLVLERQTSIGQLAHPCYGIVTPVPGFIRGRWMMGDLFFPQIDLLIPRDLVVGYPRMHTVISPSGFELEASMMTGDGTPSVAVDKCGLLRLMAEQAQEQGAEIRLGTDASHLITEGDRVCGVQTASGEFRADLVLSAEGVARRLSHEAGIFTRSARPARHALVAVREYRAPAVRRTGLGQITTLGRRYTSAREGFGTVVMPAPGHATATFTLFADGPHHHTLVSSDYYLDEYVNEDPRVRHLFSDAELVGSSVYSATIEQVPVQVARPGFLSLGDAATPAGHTGLLTAMYMGRKAALVAAEALDEGDFSVQRLGLFERLYQSRLAEALQTDRDLMLSLAQSTDSELDRLCQVLATTTLDAPFFAGWQGVPWQGAQWLNRQYPAGTYGANIVDRVLNAHPAWPQHAAGLWSMPLSQPAAAP